MWVLPKNVLTSFRSALDMGESKWDYETFSQECERSLTARSKTIAWQTWSRKLKRDKWMRLLYVRALPTFHSKVFEEYLTLLLQEDSHASHSQELQENEDQQKIPDTSSPSSSKASESATHQLSFLKMWRELSPQRPETGNRFSSMCLKIWNDWVSEQRQEYSQRQKSVQGINERGSLSWPTPTARDWKDGTAKACANVPSNCLLGREVHKYPDQTSNSTSGNQDELYLSPDWTEQLMGLEVGWTQLPSEWID
jgi:hypothetical protein